MTARKPLPGELRAGPFRVRHAASAGVARSRLGRRDLQQPFWGVRDHAGSGQDLEALCRALQLRMPAGAFFSHQTAALLLRMPLPLRAAPARPLHVGVPAPDRAMDANDIVGHSMRTLPGDVIQWRGLRLTSPARTWLDLSSTLSLVELVAAGDHLVHWRHPLATIDELADAAARYAGRRGRRAIRAALPLLRTRAESPRESMLRVLIVLAGLPEPECNWEIVDDQGRFLARGDLAYPDFKLCLEYQGDYHRTDKNQWRRDIGRTQDLEDHGWQVLQFTEDDLRRPAALTARIERRLAARGWVRLRLPRLPH